MNVLADMEWARKDFEEIVWPRAKTLFSPCELICVEGTTLDLEHATDYLMVREDGRKIALACRVQRVRSSYNSFTVRWSRETGAITEFEKLASGEPGPAFHLHGYVRYDDAFLSVGIMRTADLMKAVQHMDIEVRQNREGRGDADFIPVWWDALMKLHEVRIIRETPPWIDDARLRKLEEEHKNRGRPKPNLSFVGYDPHGRFLHYCHCGEWGAHGYGVNRAIGELGTWYCARHKPEEGNE